MHDLNVVIRYETYQRFKLKFPPIYTILDHILRKNPAEPKPARILRRNVWATFVVMKQSYDLR
jgi:hypothetical protein